MKINDIGKQIKFYRIERNLTQQELADKIGTSWEIISRYERGINNPYKKLDSILKALNISLEEFFDNKKELIINEIPLFTNIPKNFEFSRKTTSFFYTCPKWVYKADPEAFAIDTSLLNRTQQGVYYISKNTYPYKKHTVLYQKEKKLQIDSFKNQKRFIGVVLAEEIKLI